MKINRTSLLNTFEGFVKSGHGLVVGPPGVGKTYLVSELSERLEQQSIPNLQIAVDTLGDGTSTAIQEALQIDKDLITKLKEEEVAGGVLLLDGYDAARSEKGQRNLLEFIRRAKRELSSWTVIVVVRTYDAEKSPELNDLFPAGSSGFSGQIHCRHFVIPPLEEFEIQSLATRSPNLLSAYETATDDLKELLKIPFNLWLLERLLPGASDTTFAGVQSQAQLLGMFWNRRVTSSSTGLTRQHVLAGILEQMISQRSLSASRTQTFDPKLVVEWSDLLSGEVIVEQTFGNRVKFSHNILFDYAVSVLALDLDPAKLVSFLNEDRSRQLFLRPSFVFYFGRLWHEDSNQFWATYRFLLEVEGVEGRLLGRLVPPTVVVQECQDFESLAPLLSMQNVYPGIGPTAALHVLRALRTWEPRAIDFWVRFLNELASSVSFENAWEIALSLEIILKNPNADVSILGEAARKLTTWCWEQRATKRESADTLLGRFGIPLVARTYSTDPATSNGLIRPVLNLVKEPGFPIQVLYQLANNVEPIALVDPGLVGDVYRTVFSASEQSQEKTQMGGSTVLVLTSTRRQDFEMCQYLLLQFFPTFLQISLDSAIAAGIDAVNLHVVANHSVESEQPFSFRGGVAFYRKDRSVFWANYSDHHDPVHMLDQVNSRLEELVNQSDATEELQTSLDVIRDHARVAVCWKRLLAFMSKHPGHFVEASRELCLARPILMGEDTLYEIGKLLAAIAGTLSLSELESVERFMLSLPSDARKNRLISQIPANLLITAEGKQLIEELLRTDRSFANEPLVSFRMSQREYTNADWLQDRGVDIELPTNRRVRELSANLTNAIDSPDKPIAANVIGAAFIAAKELRNELQTTGGIDGAIQDSAWTNLGKFVRFVLDNVKDPEEPVSLFARDVMFECTSYVSLLDEDDLTFKSLCWSPTPRTEVAHLVPTWFARTGDSRALDIFETQLDSPFPAVRYLAAHELWRIANQEPNRFWSAVDRRICSEKNEVVLQGLLVSVGRAISLDESRGTEVIVDLRATVFSESAPKELTEMYLDIVAWLVVVRESESATGLLKEILGDPCKYSKELRMLAHDVGTRISRQRNEPTKEATYGRNAVSWLIQIIDAAQSGLEYLRSDGADKGKGSAFEDLYLLIDSVVTSLWVAGNGVQSIEAKEYYQRVKPLLNRISDFATVTEFGLMPSTAHHAMEFLHAFIGCDPRGVLKMAWLITSRSPGYNLDSMAIDRVVKLVEVFLADHRDQLREPESLQHLLGLLDIFAETGWSEALRLIWRLDEVFR